jgi:hypothetical protein
MNELDTWRAANILLKRYGHDALLDQADVQGCSAWIRIANAIAELDRRAPRFRFYYAIRGGPYAGAD